MSHSRTDPHTPARSLAAAIALAAAAAAQAVTATPVDTLLVSASAAYDAGRQRPVILRRFHHPTTCDLGTWNGADWVPILPPITVPMTDGTLVYDALRDRLAAFESAGRLWFITGQTVSAGPSLATAQTSGRYLVHDHARDELVAFGGCDEITYPQPMKTYRDTTYVLRQGAWQSLTPAVRPAARSGYALAYDMVRQRTVLFGGHSTTPLADTWEWNGTSWTAIPGAGPVAGDAYGTFDPAAQRVVVRDAGGAVWSFDGAAWTSLGGATTPRFSNSTLVYDGQKLLLAGGWTVTFPQRSLIETWRLQSGSWQRVPTSVHMHPDYSALMAYDSVRREMLCLSGQIMVNWIPTTTWTWNGAWTERPGSAPAWGGMAFDAARGEAVLFGGRNGGMTAAETWTWNGTLWTQRTPAQSPPAESAYSYARLADDPVRQVIVLVGSGGSWLWDGTNWTQPGGPQPPPGDLLVWDPVRGAVVLAGTPSGATWEWNGQWQQVSATGGPTRGNVMTSAFDPSRGRTFGYTMYAEHEWTGAVWITRALPLPMQLQYARDMATDMDRGRVLFRGVIAPSQGIQLHVLGPTPSRVDDAGGGCPDGVMLTVEQRPATGTTIEFASAVAPPGPAGLLFSLVPVSFPIGACTLVADGSIAVVGFNATAASRVDLPLTVPASPVLRGFACYVQAAAAPGGVLKLSRAVRLTVGD